MTSAAIDLGATCLRVAYRGRDGVEVVRAADGADGFGPPSGWPRREDARVGEAAAAGPPGEIITSVRADLLADPRGTARDRYFHGQFQSPDLLPETCSERPHDERAWRQGRRSATSCSACRPWPRTAARSAARPRRQA